MKNVNEVLSLKSTIELAQGMKIIIYNYDRKTRAKKEWWEVVNEIVKATEFDFEKRFLKLYI